MADALANVIAVFPSTDSARWIVARLTPELAHKVRSGPTQEGPSCSHLSSQNILHGTAHLPERLLTILLSYDDILII